MPIIHRSLARAEYLGAAIASRGYRSGKELILLRDVLFKDIDYLVTIISIIVVLIVIIMSPWVLNIVHYRFTVFLFTRS